MECDLFFGSHLWSTIVDIDNANLEKEIYDFKNNNENHPYSSNGGYQGDLFYNKEWIDKVAQNCPYREDKPLSNIMVYSWCNINPKGASNSRHLHADSNIFLSGVYYVKVPKYSGQIRFWDPRGPLVHVQKDHEYFNDGMDFHFIDPEPGLLIYFPSWLEHDVTVNDSDEDRISIAFNISADFEGKSSCLDISEHNPFAQNQGHSIKYLV